MPTVAWPSRSETTLGWTPAFSANGRVGVADVVQPDARQAVLCHYGAEQPGEMLGVEGRTVLPAEQQAVVLPDQAGSQPFLGLSDPVRPEDGRPAVEGDLAPALARLGGGDQRPTAD